jgi:aminopeptidase N
MRRPNNRIRGGFCAPVFIAFIMLTGSTAAAQLRFEEHVPAFTRKDTLRGMLRPERTCYDVRWYHLNVRIDPDEQSLSGSTTMRFTLVDSSSRLQIDLFENMSLDSITLDGGNPLSFIREFDAVFVSLPHSLATGSDHNLVAYYRGKPRVARRPPWDGGFTWTRDAEGNPWVCVTCQGTGASLWWPNKDHQSDEPDSMLISVTIPAGLEDVSNGRLRGVSKLPDGWSRYDWGVTYPINNYCVTVNIGKFAHFSDIGGLGDSLTLDYYVMPQNLEKAREQFVQVKPILACYERDFGPFPFYRDGYKLVESPHPGMEHQTAVAYGNRYRQGYLGRASSRYGLMFDFIIAHESAHEWWGNSVTSKDLADMWIHEGFAAYAEGLYVECTWGKEAMLDYLNGKKSEVRNDRPIIGPYNVNEEGSGDMYPKGALMLNTLRNVIDNDSLWFGILRGIQTRYRYKTVTTDDVVHYVNDATGRDLTCIFDQYLRHTSFPELDVELSVKGTSLSARYRWRAEVPGFAMPVKVTTSPGVYQFITPTPTWQSVDLGTMDPKNFKVADDLFAIETKITVRYIL